MTVTGPGGIQWVMDAWFIEVYGRVMATFRTKERAQEALAAWPKHEHPYLTHGPARLDACR